MENVIYNGDSLSILKTLPSESVDCMVTSPPYWSLRDYGTDGIVWDSDDKCKHDWIEHKTSARGGHSHPDRLPTVGANKAEMTDGISIRFGYTSNFCNKCGAWKGSLGLEPTMELYIKHLCDIFDEVRRVLKKTGTCWVNIGDTYGGSDKGVWKGTTQKETYVPDKKIKTTGDIGKSLAQIPSRFGIEMTNRGWILRNEIIWHKPNAMPCSVKDRFTVDFEKVFFFVKNKKYNFETQLEPAVYIDNRASGMERQDKQYRDKVKGKYSSEKEYGGGGTSFNGHSGNYKSDETPIGTPGKRNKRTVWAVNTKPLKEAHFATYPESLIEPMIQAGCPTGGVVLDPFFGAGTSALVAVKQGKKYIGIELNSEYINIAKERLQKVQLPLPL